MPRGGRRTGAGRPKGSGKGTPSIQGHVSSVAAIVPIARAEIRQITHEIATADLHAIYEPVVKPALEKLLSGKCDRYGKPDPHTVDSYYNRLLGKPLQPVAIRGGVPAITIVFAVPRATVPAPAGAEGFVQQLRDTYAGPTKGEKTDER
jgi:hypothetical protein